MIKLKIKKTHPEAIIPKYTHVGDAGMDFYASADFEIDNMERNAVPTGVSMENPEGYFGLIWDKSGIAQNEGIKTIGGVIDSSFRGEIRIAVINLSGKKYIFKKGHKVAQMLIQKVERVMIEEVENLSESTRGEKGFGSSGK